MQAAGDVAHSNLFYTYGFFVIQLGRKMIFQNKQGSPHEKLESLLLAVGISFPVSRTKEWGEFVAGV